MEVKSFENLEVWQIGRDLVTKVYALAASLPQSEAFRLIAQIQATKGTQMTQRTQETQITQGTGGMR